MSERQARSRIWGWYFFDWASQPYHTVLLTFVFGPFFASIATGYYADTGLEEQTADAKAQSIWSLTLTIAGLIVGFGAPFLGALADATRRRMPWLVGFSIAYVIAAAALWSTAPDGSNLTFALFMFGFGFVAAEYALIFTNAQLPGLIGRSEIGRLSGTGFAFGYLGGLIALVIALVVFVEQANGKTVAGLLPGFGVFDAEAKEGTRAVGPLVAIWFAVFMIPYFLWMREAPVEHGKSPKEPLFGKLVASVRDLKDGKSLGSFLIGSMLYRDALNGLYGFGGTYALLVLNWEVAKVGVFGIISVIAAAVLSWIGGRMDRRFGPKPVIVTAILVLMLVCVLIAGIAPDAVFGIQLGTGASDMTYLLAGVLIGGFGGILQAASRTLMVRHTQPGAETVSFGLYGLAGRATSFLAPALIGLVTVATGDVRNGVIPLFVLFLLGLVLLRWTHPEGDRADPWSDKSSAQ